MSNNNEVEAIGNLIAARLSVLYPEKWAFNNPAIINVRKHEYATTRGIVSAKLTEVSRAIDIWKSREKHHPEPRELVEYIEIARKEIQREVDISAAKSSLSSPSPYIDSKKQNQIAALIEKYRREHPTDSWSEICKAAAKGAFRC